MKEKIFRNVINTTLCIAVGFLIFSTNVSAISPEDITIPVSVELEGTLPKTEETFIIHMQGETEETPMPEGTVDGIYSATITGNGSTILPIAKYDKVGIYNYVIWQEAGTNEKCTYDESIYNLKVTITNNISYDGYDITVALRKDGEAEKLSEIVFENEYETVKPSAKPKTGDTTDLTMWVFLMSTALMVIAGVLVKKCEI